MIVVVVGAGINGVTAAIELRRRGNRVTLVDPGPLPHPLAASTDISKAVRGAYGNDEDYTVLAERATALWREWNAEFAVRLYHEVGFLFLRRRPLQTGDFEHESLQLLERRGHKIERIDRAVLRRRFPAWNAELYPDGFFECEAGYVESGRAVAVLVGRAKSIGVELLEGRKFAGLIEVNGTVTGIVLENGVPISADAVVSALGAWTPFILPFTSRFFRATGHPVLHLAPPKPELFEPPKFPVFAADISSTGFYGFPLNRDGVVKIARHGAGRRMSPESSARAVTPDEEAELRTFVNSAFPALTNAPVVHQRICLYCDTHDGDLWIAADPQRQGLVIAAGDSGHGFKFAPVLGELIADAVERKSNPLLEKFRWRPDVRPGTGREAARCSSEPAGN